MKKIIATMVVLTMTGCATVKLTPPLQVEVEKSRLINQGFEKSWARAVDWFADHNVTIEKIEKPSGLITAKYALSADSSFLDCGAIEATGFLKEPVIERYGVLNVTVREQDETRTKVNVNFFGEFTLTGNDAWDARIVKSQGKCASTGRLEDSILNFVQN